MLEQSHIVQDFLLQLIKLDCGLGIYAIFYMYLMTCLDGCCSVTFQPTVSKSRCKCNCSNYEEGSVFHRLWQHAAKLNRKKDMRGHVCKGLTDPRTGQRLFQPLAGRKPHHDVSIPWPPQFPSLAFDNPSYQNTYEIWELQSSHCKVYTCLLLISCSRTSPT